MEPHDPAAAPVRRSHDILAQARRRRFNRVLSAVLLGCFVAAYTWGALRLRVIAEDQNDLLPVPIEAVILGAAFAVGSLPVPWSIIGRILLPMPTFFLYFTVFIGKDPPLPFYAALVASVIYSAALTVLARHLADRPLRPVLGSRSRTSHLGAPPDSG